MKNEPSHADYEAFICHRYQLLVEKLKQYGISSVSEIDTQENQTY